MKLNIILLLVFSIFLVSIASAQVETLGTFRNGECIDLIQTCANCTYNNVSSVLYPNSTASPEMTEIAMSKSGTTYTTTFCNSSANGQYIVNGYGDPDGSLTIWAYDFFVTPNGELSSGSGSAFYIGMLAIFLIFFVISLVGLFKTEDYRGKFALYWVCHVLLIAISFIAWNMSKDFLTSAPFVIAMFRIIWYFVWISAFPMVLLSIAWVVYTHVMVDEIKAMMDRGMTSEEAWDRKGGRR